MEIRDQFKANQAKAQSTKVFQKACKYLKENFGVDVAFSIVPENPHWGKDSQEKFNFYIALKKETPARIDDQKHIAAQKETEIFYFSQSHRKPFHFGRVSIDQNEQAKALLVAENSYPDLWGFLNCMCSDADCLEYDFEEWAENLGFDPDSRKAEKTYQACIEQTKKIQKLIDLDQVREYLEENDLN